MTLLERTRLVALGGAIGLVPCVGMKLILPAHLETVGCIIASITAAALALAILRLRSRAQSDGDGVEAGFRIEELLPQDSPAPETAGEEPSVEKEAEAGVLVSGRR